MGPLAALAIPAIAQAGMGLYQTIKGGQMGNNNPRPYMPMPSSFQEALNSVKERASRNTMPGEDIFRRNQNEVMAGAVDQFLGSVGSAGDLSQGITSLYGEQMRGENQLAQRREQYLDLMDNRKEDWLSKAAEWENLQFQVNELQPYQEKAAAASAMKGAGIQNLFGALNNVGIAALYSGGGGVTPNGATGQGSASLASSLMNFGSTYQSPNPNNAGGNSSFAPTGNVGNPGSVVPDEYAYLFNNFQFPSWP